MQDILIKHLMTQGVEYASPTTPLSHVIRAMKDHRHSCMIVGQNKVPVGIVTERDIVRHFSELTLQGQSHDPTVMEIMSSPPITIHENSTLLEALTVARSNRIRHLPVTDDQGRLVGIVTQTDLIDGYFQFAEMQTEILEREVANRTQELVDANEKLRHLSMEDALLGIGNRRAMELDLYHTHFTAARYQRCYAVVLFDVDYFKLYNDRYGHAAGDKALQQISGFLKDTIRKSDRVYRYGGEELLLLLPETPQEAAYTVAKRLIEGLADCRIPHEAHPLKVITLSGGMSCPDDETPGEPWHDVVQRADWALYEAKHQGRNRLVAFSYSDLSSPAEQSVSLQ